MMAADCRELRFVIGSRTSEVLGAGSPRSLSSLNAGDMYVFSRAVGMVGVTSFVTMTLVGTRHLPQPASPDMAGVSADRRTLWLSGRYNSFVSAINARIGRLQARFVVGDGNGLCVWSQPGRYSLGHIRIVR
jgi:hypothetical protein